MRKPVSRAGHVGIRDGLALAMAAVLAAGCGSSVSPPTASTRPSTSVGSLSAPLDTSPASTTPPHGGTLRVVVPMGSAGQDLGWSSPTFLDPHLSLSNVERELWRCCLVRTLYSYNGLSVEEGGSHLQPDLAEALPGISADGYTWTIHLKAGIHYGPPLQNVEITARDFIRGFHRAVSPALDFSGGLGAAFLPNIDGVWDYMAGTAPSISGLEAPDDHTLVVRLAHPASGPPDRGFATQLAIAAAMPLPPDPLHPDAPFGIAQGADTGFGRFLVSSGPYMLEGSDQLDFTIPGGQRPTVAGISASTITLVRNPSWVAATDTLRPAYPDRIEIRPAASAEAAVGSLEAGSADLVWPMDPLPTALLAAFQADSSGGRIRVDTAANIRAVMLNLAAPPFDDIHVRKALNYAIDKQHLVDIQGGPMAYGVVGHLSADSLEDNLLLDYDPYATPGSEGDIDAARAEMAKSAYDTNGDGRCDVAACRHIRVLTRPKYEEVARSFAADVEPLSIGLEVDALGPEAFMPTVNDPQARIPAVITTGMVHVAIDAGMGLNPFYGPTMLTDPTSSDWLGGNVGASAELLKQWGYAVTQVPNVDDRMEACFALAGAPRFQCFAAVDQYLMENVVPWVPYNQTKYAAITSSRVVSYGFDELAQTTSLDQLALKQ